MQMLKHLFMMLIFGTLISCNSSSVDQERVPLLEVEGKFLYLDQVQDIIPPQASEVNKEEIDRLLDDYKKSLTIHQYQQKLIQQRLPEEPSEEEMKKFYEDFSSQFTLKENLLKGILLVVPVGAPDMGNVRRWVQSGDNKSLEKIEKYSLQHGLSYDYFADRWMPFNEILRKMPMQIENQSDFLASHKFYEVSDTLKHYMLSIEAIKRIGETEPYETAKEKISNIILNKLKSEFIMNFENELYKDAIQDGTVTFFNK